MRVAGQDDEQVEIASEQQEEQAESGESQVEGEDQSGEGEDDEEVVVQIGDEEPAASEEAKAAPEWVKKLREKQKVLAKENAELRALVATGKPAPQGKPELPPKPKLADYEFDEDKYEQARDEWDAKKREVDAFEANQRQAQDAQSKRAQAVNDHYATSAKALKVKDFQDAEDVVAGELDQMQQAILKAGASNPGAMVYALGKNITRLQALASIKDPVKFAVAIGDLQRDIKVIKRASTKPAPETPLRSTGSGGGSTATLERLQAEADRTGDRTKVIAYKRAQRQSGK